MLPKFLTQISPTEDRQVYDLAKGPQISPSDLIINREPGLTSPEIWRLEVLPPPKYRMFIFKRYHKNYINVLRNLKSRHCDEIKMPFWVTS